MTIDPRDYALAVLRLLRASESAQVHALATTPWWRLRQRRWLKEELLHTRAEILRLKFEGFSVLYGGAPR